MSAKLTNYTDPLFQVLSAEESLELGGRNDGGELVGGDFIGPD